MKYYIIMLAFILLEGCSNTRHYNLNDAKQSIIAQNERLHQVVKTKNISMLDEVYAKDAYFLSPGKELIQGRENIKHEWQSSIERMKEMKSTSIAFSGTDDLISEVGVVETLIETPDTSYVYKAKYNNVWEKDADGRYRLKVDVWNKLP